MKDITLLVMAAGMGSRYGGLKQLDWIGPNNETIIDYSVFDAIRAGFSKVVFIIRKEFEDEFKEKITNKYLGKIEVKFAFQDLNFLPEGFFCPAARVKPWGTGHAILTARDLIGTTIENEKQFNVGKFTGIVSSHNPMNGNYRVKYTDGDVPHHLHMLVSTD